MEEITMKIFGTVMKIVAALAAVAGIVYVVATYGDKIVAWAKKTLNLCAPCCDDDCCCEECECCEEECCCEEPCACCEASEEAPAVDAPAAEEADFEA